VTSTGTVTTCSDCWQVFSTAEHKQKLYHFAVSLLHAWGKPHSKVTLLNDKWECGRRFQCRYSCFSLFLLISLLQKSLNHPYIFLARNASHACYVTAALFKTRPCFCDRSVLQIVSQFALLSYSSSDRLTILLAQNCRSHLSVLLPQHCWIHLSACLFFSAALLF
jgi:hypothetical protein